jgi:hypothetical protein
MSLAANNTPYKYIAINVNCKERHPKFVNYSINYCNYSMNQRELQCALQYELQ